MSKEKVFTAGQKVKDKDFHTTGTVKDVTETHVVVKDGLLVQYTKQEAQKYLKILEGKL